MGEKRDSDNTGLCLVLQKEADMMGGGEQGDAVGVKHSVALSPIPKTLLVIWLPGKLAFKERRLYWACIIALPGSYCSHDKLVN